MIGKLSLTQSEIANEINLKLDLAENTLNRIESQVPENFGDAFIHLYKISCETIRIEEKMFQDMEQLNQETHRVSLRLNGIEKATGADLCGSS